MNTPICRWPLGAAAILGATAVMAGAFGAHGLRERVSDRYLAIWETAADYQLAHALAVLALALALLLSSRLANVAATQWVLRCWLVGTVIFSGSLYLLVLTGIGWLGAITPIGGTLLIIGWLLLLKVAVAVKSFDASGTDRP